MALMALLDGGKRKDKQLKSNRNVSFSWLFVINAIITILWGFGFFIIPGLPNRTNPRSFWFTEDMAHLTMERLERHNRAEPKKTSWAGVRYRFLSL
jgi:hypothetical protein